MTLNLPLLYFVWTEEYCQTSLNKNKSPNLWHVTSILVCCIFAQMNCAFLSGVNSLLELRYENQKISTGLLTTNIQITILIIMTSLLFINMKLQLIYIFIGYTFLNLEFQKYFLSFHLVFTIEMRIIFYI